MSDFYDHEPPLTPDQRADVMRHFYRAINGESLQPLLDTLRYAHRECPECIGRAASQPRGWRAVFVTPLFAAALIAGPVLVFGVCR